MKDQHILILFPLVMLLIVFVGLFMNTPENTERTMEFIISFGKDMILRPSIIGF